jgi:siroheme synthase-like protein
MKDETFLAGLRLRDRHAVVVGGSDEAARRVRDLRAAGARVTALSIDPCRELVSACRETAASLIERDFQERDLDDAWLCVLGDRDDALTARIGTAAEKARVFFCAIDQPAHNSFSHVAIARAGPVSIAISTNGGAPALARRLREELERLMADSALGAFAERLAELRRMTPPVERARVLNVLVQRLRFTGKIDVPST